MFFGIPALNLKRNETLFSPLKLNLNRYIDHNHLQLQHEIDISNITGTGMICYIDVQFNYNMAFYIKKKRSKTPMPTEKNIQKEISHYRVPKFSVSRPLLKK